LDVKDEERVGLAHVVKTSLDTRQFFIAEETYSQGIYGGSLCDFRCV